MIFNRGCNKHTMISINKRKSFCPETGLSETSIGLIWRLIRRFKLIVILHLCIRKYHSYLFNVMRLFFLRYNHIFFSSLFFIHNFNTVIIWWDIRYPVFLLTLKVFMWNNIYYMQSICIIYCTSNWYIFSCSSLICHGFTKLPSYNVSMLVLSQLGFSS